ncbi:RNA polymerase sigma-70 factor [Sunxiuqinia sp. A32]
MEASKNDNNENLVSLLKQGDHWAFEKIYFEFFDVLFALSFQYILDKEEAKTIVQDSFMKLWEVRGELKSDTNIRNYLYTLTKNRSLNYLRDQKTAWKHLNQLREMEFHYAAESLSLVTDNYFEFKELLDKVNQSIDSLPKELKEVFILSRYDELRYREIAERLQISEKTVEARMSKALKILRNDLKDYLPVIYLLTDIIRNS